MASHIETIGTAAGTRYRAVVTIGGGRGAERITRTERTLTCARRSLRELERVAAGELPRHDHTVADVMHAWLAHLESVGETAPQTVMRYRQVCTTLSGTPIWHRHMASLRADEIESALADTGGQASTRHLRWRVLRAGLRWGARCWQTADPTVGVRPPRAVRVERTVLDGGGMADIIEAAAGNGLLDPFVLLAIATGKRRNEVLALRVGDLDGDVVRVRGSLECIADSWRIKATKTGATGVVRLPEFAQRRVDELRRARFGNPQAFLCSPDGGKTPLEPHLVSLEFRALADGLGLPMLRVHDLRHSFATVLHDAGLSPTVMQRALGHADVRTTLGTYTHPANVAELVARTMQEAVHGDSLEGAGVNERRTR